jgi:predicted N-acyltransferase
MVPQDASKDAHFEAKPRTGQGGDAADSRPADADDTGGIAVRVVTRIAELDAAQWNALAGDSPFLNHAFLDALETTGCVGKPIGWEPVHLALFRDGQLAAAMPLYVKHHSWGEFVFDWAWASAYERHGLKYYPKLVACVPFSPVPGARLLATNDADRAVLIQAAIKLCGDLEFSSFHLLFPTATDCATLDASPLAHRSGFQFHWQSPSIQGGAGYADFDAFLADLTHDKRKKIKQERKKLAAAGITFRWLNGHTADDSDWAHFWRCYADTYERKRSDPHLNPAFFAALRKKLPDKVVLILADQHGEPVAASFCLRDGRRLYGRHWGTLAYVPGLHFETCYQQGIEYAIAHKLEVFEGGAQGEHKLARGLVPVTTHSYHWLENAEFRQAVANFVEREADAIAHYVDEMEGPFRKAPPVTPSL